MALLAVIVSMVVFVALAVQGVYSVIPEITMIQSPKLAAQHALLAIDQIVEFAKHVQTPIVKHVQEVPTLVISVNLAISRILILTCVLAPVL